MGRALHDVSHLAERLHVGKPMVGRVRLHEPGEFVGVLRPVEVAAVDDASADLRRVPVHVLRRRVRDDVAAELERTAEDGRLSPYRFRDESCFYSSFAARDNLGKKGV